MIHGLKPYPKYKDSGVEWLGQVPESWEVTRLKRVARLNPSKSEAVPMLAHDPAVIFLPMERVSADGRIDVTERKSLSKLWSGLTYFRRSDVILAKITPCFENGKGACLDGLPTEIGFGSTEFHVLRPCITVLPQFLYQLTTMSAFRRLGAQAMIGAAGQQRVPQSFVGDFQIGLPPLSEQSAIVRFVAYMDRRIRRYIRAKQKLIALLNEEKQAVIQHAVTRGLDPTVRFKPSGVEWLGEIPEHWEVMSNRRLFRETTRKYRGEELSQLSLSQRDGLIETDAMQESSLRTASYDNFKGVLPDDLVVNRFKAHLGVFFASTKQGIVTFHYGVFRPVRPSKTKYFELLYHTRPYRAIYAGASNGMTVGLQNLSNQNFYKTRSIVPPVEEQEQILRFVVGETQSIDTAIRSSNREIDLLREYRTRLIADVVTGKLDVRAAAAALPDEPEEPEENEPLDEDTEAEEPEAEPEEA